MNHQLSTVVASTPWIQKHRLSLLSTFCDCESVEDMELIASLLTKFVFVDFEEEQKAYDKIIRRIQDVWRLPPENTVIVPCARDGYMDGSHAVAWKLQALITLKRISPPYSILSKFNHLLRTGSHKKNIILVDDFIGSGVTFTGIINQLESHEKQNGLTSNKYVAAIAGMRDGINHIMGSLNGCYVHRKLNKGIKDNFRGRRRAEAYFRMKRLEEALDKSYDPLAFPFGYKMSEALYGSSAYPNSPNNVFPYFWVPRYRDGRRRESLFFRREK